MFIRLKNKYGSIIPLFWLTVLIILMPAIEGCNKNNNHKIYIALSKGAGDESYLKYSRWLTTLDSNVVCIDLYHITKDSAMHILETCAGLVLTGGPDIDPGRYGKIEDTARCEIDQKRDTLEFALLDKAMKLKMPILGICRGEQLINNAFGGSLIVDIPQDIGISVVHQSPVPDSVYHEILVIPGTLLADITNIAKGMVNSNHHQAIAALASDLRISAKTRDGLVEAVEWKNPEGKPYLLAVQWHPERLDPSNPFSGKIGRSFLDKVRDHMNHHTK